VILKCEVVKKRLRMLRYFVILKCEEKKKTPMLRYFVLLKCEVGKMTLHAALLCDSEV